MIGCTGTLGRFGTIVRNACNTLLALDLQIAMRNLQIDRIRATRRFGAFAVLALRATGQRLWRDIRAPLAAPWH
jgi:hypothetical protein